jgi:hypothetical protein
MNCQYCPDKATTSHNEEYLCERHYDVLYEKELKVIQLTEVPKTEKEKKLNKKYMKLIQGEITPELIDDFKKDVKKLKIKK